MSSILYQRHLSSHHPHALLTVRRTLKSHKALRRIFHAAISASRDERRYSSRRPIWSEKNEEISFKRGRTKISLASYRMIWCRTTTEKKRRSQSDWAAKDGNGREKAIQRKKRPEYKYVTSHCCLPYSRLSWKMNISALLLPAVLLCFIYIIAASNECA